MKKQDINIYREIKRNTEMAIKALDAVTDKIYDERLAEAVADQELQYSRLHDRAVQKLAEGKAQIYRSNAMENMMLKIGIGYNTLLNTSTGHIAEMIIKGSNNGVLEMEKVLAHNEEMADTASRALAKELIAMENSNIKTLKEYLQIVYLYNFCAIFTEKCQKLLRFSGIKFIVQLKKSFYNKAYGNQVVMNLYTN